MRLLSPFAAVLCARNFQMWRQPMVKSLTKGIRLELHLKIGEHVYRQSEDIKSHSPPQTRNKKTASYLVTAQKSPLRVIYLQCSQFGRHVSLISSGEWEREREQEREGSYVVSLRGSQTCWDGEMRPGYWLTTGRLQVSRPMLWLGLKTSFQFEERALLRRQCRWYYTYYWLLGYRRPE